MRNFKEHLILKGSLIKEALITLDKLAADAILFVVDEEDKLIGSLTDGDVRRGLINGVTIEQVVDNVIQESPKFISKGQQNIEQIIAYRDKNYKVLPVVDKQHKIVNIVNFRSMRSYLPIDAIIMAGGKGTRLRPLTEKVPKPLLKVGEVPIMEHNLNRLALYGIDDFWISVNYLGEQIEAYFGDGQAKNLCIDYLWETKPLGTIGAAAQIDNFNHEYVLLTNSDILTNLDYEHFFLDFIRQEADMSVVTIPYKVDVPYAVLETSNGQVLNLKEKPTYTYYSNGGIYLMKRNVFELIPKGAFFNATDLMEKLINDNQKVISYPMSGYWLDIGKHEDFEKAQKDITQIKF